MSTIIGLIMIIVGAIMMAKSEWLLSNFGRIDFFEQHLGTSGGSRLGYKLTGALVIFFGVLLFTGLIVGFLEWILGPIIRHSRNLG